MSNQLKFIHVCSTTQFINVCSTSFSSYMYAHPCSVHTYNFKPRSVLTSMSKHYQLIHTMFSHVQFKCACSTTLGSYMYLSLVVKRVKYQPSNHYDTLMVTGHCGASEIRFPTCHNTIFEYTHQHQPLAGFTRGLMLQFNAFSSSRTSDVVLLLVLQMNPL